MRRPDMGGERDETIFTLTRHRSSNATGCDLTGLLGVAAANRYTNMTKQDRLETQTPNTDAGRAGGDARDTITDGIQTRNGWQSPSTATGQTREAD